MLLIFLDTRELESLSLITNRIYEEAVEWAIRNNIKKGNKVIDVGANIGYYALLENKIVGRNGQVIAIEPSPENYKMLYVPERFAHGFQSLEDNTEIFYQVSQFYSSGAEKGVRWNDPTFNIKWPLDEKIISKKDSSWKNFEG